MHISEGRGYRTDQASAGGDKRQKFAVRCGVSVLNVHFISKEAGKVTSSETMGKNTSFSLAKNILLSGFPSCLSCRNLSIKLFNTISFQVQTF
jgi:hypothetical protein